MTILGTTIGFVGYLIQIFLKKPAIAIKLYRLADRLGNRNSLSLAAYGILLFEKKNYEKALDKFNSIKKPKKMGELWRIVVMNKALCYWKLDSVERAVEVLENLREDYDYLNENFLTSLGYFHLLNGNYEEALKYSREALEDEPEHAAALDNIGQIFYHQGKMEEAEKYFLEALQHKDLIDSKYYLGLIYESKGELAKAEEYFIDAYNSEITAFSTVQKEEVDEKYRNYTGN